MTADHELMRRYLNGDINAFTEIYDLYRGRVHAYLHRRATRSQDADELLQAVFMKFHQSRHQFTFEHPLLQWLYVISRTTYIDFYRKDHSDRTVPFDSERDEQVEAPRPNDEPEISFRVIESLPSEQQEVIRLRLIDEKSYNEIASKLRKSETSIRQIFSRAMKKLKTQILAEQKK